MKQISANRSRQIARQKMKDLGFNLTRELVIHHIDHNPLNNDFNNLVVMYGVSHTKYHAIVNFPKVQAESIKRLGALLVVSNEYGWTQLNNI